VQGFRRRALGARTSVDLQLRGSFRLSAQQADHGIPSKAIAFINTIYALQ
jgi:hypothetical protein